MLPAYRDVGTGVERCAVREESTSESVMPPKDERSHFLAGFQMRREALERIKGRRILTRSACTDSSFLRQSRSGLKSKKLQMSGRSAAS
jgi:hypothetical protein